MRPVLVQRIALSLTAALTAAAGLFAWSVSRHRAVPAEPGGAALDGRASFELHCGACHAAADLVLDTGGADVEDRARAVLKLLDFLDGHGNASSRDDRAIVEFLVDVGEGQR